MAQKISDDGRIEVICSSGIAVTVKPISLKLLERFDLEHQEPSPPEIEAEVIGGGIEMVEDDEDEDYLVELEEYRGSVVGDLLNLIVDFAIDVDLPEDETWINRLERSGIPVDDGDEEYAYAHYIVMIDTVSDLKKIVAQTFILSGVGEEAVDSWLELF